MNASQCTAISEVRRSDGAQKWLIAILLTAVVCTMEINELIFMGILALPPTYDDVSYYLDGARFLRTFHESGFGGLMRLYLADPTHSPMSTILAFCGFALMGVRAWAGPVANAFVFFCFVRAFLAVAADLPLGQSLLLAVALLGVPFVGDTLMIFKPDAICSLVIAAGALFIVLRPDWLHSRKDQLLAGLLFGAALWAKPTVFPLTGLMFAISMALVSMSALRHLDIKTPIVAGAITSAIGILISLPYYALAFRQVIDYIWTTAFGVELTIWVQHIPLREHLLYYLTGPVGKSSLDLWLYVGLFLIAASILVAWRICDRRVLSRVALMLVMVVASYLAVTIPTFKGEHGLAFAAFFLIAIAMSAVTLMKCLPRGLGWIVCAFLVCFSAWQFMWPFTRDHGVVGSAYAASRWSMVHQAIDAVGTTVTGKIFYQTTPMVYLNYSTIAFQYYQRGLSPPTAEDADRISDLNVHRRRIATADIVFAVTPDASEVFSQLPTATSQFREQIIKLIEESGQFAPAI